MNIIEHNGNVMLLQHEGNRQIASAVAHSAHVLLQRVTKLLTKALRRIPGAHPF